MADEVITGKVDWASKDVIFEQDTCLYHGQMVWDDATHRGQVAVVISSATCDDVYYADVDWTAGYGVFKVSVPDDCCSTEDCSYCAGTTPSSIKMTITGSSICNQCNPTYNNRWTNLPILNGEYTLTRPGGVGCYWELITAWSGNFCRYTESGCGGDAWACYVYTRIRFQVFKTSAASAYVFICMGTDTVFNPSSAYGAKNNQYTPITGTCLQSNGAVPAGGNACGDIPYIQYSGGGYTIEEL